MRGRTACILGGNQCDTKRRATSQRAQRSHEGARVGVAALRAGSSTELRRRVFYGGDSGLYLAAGNLLRVDGGWAARAGRRIRLANVGSRPRLQDSVLAAAAGADDCEGVDFAGRDDPRDTPCTRTCIPPQKLEE